MNIQEIYESLKMLEREEIVFLIIELMKSNKLSYEDITTAYVNWLQFQKKNISDDYQELRGYIMEMWCGNKKDWSVKLKDTMHYLLDKGQLNATHEQIDKHK